MAKNIKKCRYAGCKHDGEINLDTDEYIILGGNRYYHTDCKAPCKYKGCKHPDGEVDLKNDNYVIGEDGFCWHEDCKRESDAIRDIIDCWYRNVNDDKTDFGNLNRIIKTLLGRGYEAEYILFALRKKAKFLNHPPGLFYAVDDYKLKEEWKRKKIEESMKNVKFEKPIDTIEPTFNTKVKSGSSFSDIFGGNS